MNRATRTLALALTLAAGGVGLTGCSTAPKTEAKRQNLKDDAQTTLSRLTADYPNLQNLIDQGAGYAVFPSVGKGGLVLAGSYGRGTVYENGRMIGYADITGGSFGATIGGQEYAELIIFETADEVARLRTGNFNFSGQATAVILKAGEGAATHFQEGTAVFIKPKGGAMADASIGGQKFTYTPASMAGNGM